MLQALLDRARVNGHSQVAYHGIIFAITPVEDITHTFTPEEPKKFAADFAATDEPGNQMTVEQVLARHRQRIRRHG